MADTDTGDNFVAEENNEPLERDGAQLPADAGGGDNDDELLKPQFQREDGSYDWKAHAKDVEFRFAQSKRDREAARAQRESADGLYLEPDQGDQGDGDGEGGNAAPPRLDFDKYNSEYSLHGELSASSYDELEALGLPPDMVDAWIEGQEARAERTKETIYSAVGGAEEYAALISWAADALTPEEQQSFNALAEGQDLNAFRLAVSGLHGRYQDEAGGTRAKTRITGGGTGGGGGDIYADWSQVQVDMKDSRYRSDPAFRDAVARKLDRSPLSGVRNVGDQVHRSR